MNIDGEVIVVTGAAGTIGSATAAEFVARGAKVVIADRDGTRLSEVATQLGSAVVDVIVGDVSDEAHHQDLVAAAESAGGLAVSILNAGIYLPGLVWELPPERWRLQMEVNFWGVLHGVRAAVPRMIERGRGHVVGVASGAGLVATPGLGAYVASKHAVVGVMETLRHELNRVCPGVGASVVCPGNVRSQMAGNSLAAADIDHEELSEVVDALAKQIRSGVDAGAEASTVARAIADSVEANRFWILPQPEIGWAATDRARRINDGSEPVDFLA